MDLGASSSRRYASKWMRRTRGSSPGPDLSGAAYSGGDLCRSWSLRAFPQAFCGVGTVLRRSDGEHSRERRLPSATAERQGDAPPAAGGASSVAAPITATRRLEVNTAKKKKKSDEGEEAGRGGRRLCERTRPQRQRPCRARSPAPRNLVERALQHRGYPRTISPARPSIVFAARARPIFFAGRPA